PARGTAEESISNIEISLVLDVSGSMGETSASGATKIAELQVAAKEFVRIIYAQSEPQRTSISIVPYNNQVNAGKALLDQFNHTRDHDHSHCVDFSLSDFSIAWLNTTALLSQAGHFDRATRSGRLAASSWVCNLD